MNFMQERWEAHNQTHHNETIEVEPPSSARDRTKLHKITFQVWPTQAGQLPTTKHCLCFVVFEQKNVNGIELFRAIVTNLTLSAIKLLPFILVFLGFFKADNNQSIVLGHNSQRWILPLRSAGALSPGIFKYKF